MGLPSGLRFDVEDEPTDADVMALAHQLEGFNESRWPQHQPWRALRIFVRDQGSIVAGLAGKPTAAGSSSDISGYRRICAGRGSDAN